MGNNEVAKEGAGNSWKMQRREVRGRDEKEMGVGKEWKGENMKDQGRDK